MPEQRRRRRTRGEGGLYQRASDGLWVGAVDLGWVNGRRRRVTVARKSKTRALAELTKLKQQVAQHGAPPDKAWTVAGWLEHWLEHIVRPTVRKPRTYVAYRVDVTKHLVPFVGNTRRIHRLEPHHVRALHAHLRKQKKADGTRALSPTSVRHIHQTLSLALDAAVRDGLVARNVAKMVDRPEGRAKSRQSLTADQARELLAHVAGDRVASRWLTALLSGARQGECLGLRWDHVDFDRGIIDFAWQLQRVDFRHGCGDPPACRKRAARLCPRAELAIPDHLEHIQLDGGLLLIPPKATASTRIVPMVTPLRLALELRRAAYLGELSAYAVDHGLVWPRPDGQPIRPRDDSLAWRAACVEAGVPDVELHAARHTTATLLLEAGVDVKVIGQIVGHSTAATTRGYQHVSLELARRAMDQLVDRIDLPPSD